MTRTIVKLDMLDELKLRKIKQFNDMQAFKKHLY